MYKSKLKPLSIAIAIIGTGCAFPLTALAQGRAMALEEVIVTAQKREESLQDAPIAISALTSEQLEVRGIQGMGDLIAGAIPAVKVMPFP